MPGAGELRERFTFAERVEKSDGYGNTVGDFVDQFTVSARLVWLKGGEEVMAARLAGKQPVVITIRQSIAARRITTAWRAKDARTQVEYAITGVRDPEGDRAFLDILALSGAAIG